MRKRALAIVALGAIVLSSSPSLGARIEPGVSETGAETAATTSSATLAAGRVASRLLESIARSSAPRAVAAEAFVWPVAGAINTPFGGDHDGIDIEGETGDKIIAARSGRVTFAGDDGDGYGTKIVIAHDKHVSTLYSHLSSIASSVTRKAWIDRGDVIGRVGCTGSCSGDHLHFEIQRGGRPVDPLGLLPERK